MTGRTCGSIHAFNIVQRDARGRVLGGLRVLSVVTGIPRSRHAH